MDTSPTRNLMDDPPPPLSPGHARNPSFTESITPAQYFSDFEPADDEDYDSAEEDFSFAFSAPRQSKSPDITADELFSQGKILPIYPVWSKFMPSREEAKSTTQDELEVFETASTSHPETPSDYCDWTPLSTPSSPCRKSRSTGSARKWIFHDFLAGARSQSDGKEKFLFLEKPTHSQSKAAKGKAPVQAKVEKSVKVEKKNGDGKKKEKKEVKEIDLATAYKSLYGMRKDKGKLKEGEKRKSYLPYFGFFGGGLNAFTKSSYPY
ncbi:hypothetical protein LUZ62_067735 [Rhynchospora pubera]|uniref:Uncharacterized protein n=1 Tax=Rhynchospora pubera TaxID=906938 RepID=A0AAV8CPA3_9POAL|nr:hypothetical protein LUZ62_067735 [Rhynchospora pubera]